MSEVLDRLLAAALDGEVAAAVDEQRGAVAAAVDGAVRRCGQGAGLDALLGAVLEAPPRAGRAEAALLVASAWARTPPSAERRLACIAAAPDAHAVPAPRVSEAAAEAGAADVVPSRVAARAGAYSHLGSWLEQGWPLTERFTADPLATRLGVVGSLAAAQACLADESLVATAQALRAAVAGTVSQIEHALRVGVAGLSGHARPGPGRPLESLYPILAALVMGDAAWDMAVEHCLELVAPGLYRGDDTHLTGQLGVVSLLVYGLERAGRPAGARQDIAAVLDDHRRARPLLERALADLEHAAAQHAEGGNALEGQRRPAAVRRLVIGVEQHLAHDAVGLAGLAQWVGLMAEAVPDPRAADTPPRLRVRPTHPPAWTRAWQWATDLVQRHSVAYAEESWDSAGTRGLVAMARYAVELRHPSCAEDGEELLARAAWLLIDPQRFYGIVPAELAEAGHDLDRVDDGDPVSAEWAWLHREWPDHPEQPHTAIGPRWDGLTRGIARGLPYCAAQILMQPWAVDVVARELEAGRGALPRRGRVLLTGGAYAGRRGCVERAVWRDEDARERVRPGPPVAYRLLLDEGARPDRAVAAAEHVSSEAG